MPEIFSSPAPPAVLVTGGAKRIGATIARAFGEAGWHVVIHYHRSSKEACDLADDLPSSEVVQCDLADGDAAAQMVEDLSVRLDNWCALVNSAAIFPYDDVTLLDPEANKRAMQINAETPTRMAQIFLSHSRAHKGRRVIQITDQKLENPNPDFFSYTMSKNALSATIPMLAQLAADGGAAGPDDRVYGLAPGAILASYDQSETETEISHRLNLLKRKTGADEIADACLFLAEGHLESGQTLFVDSGQHLLNQKRDIIYLARAMQNGGASR